MLYLFDLDDTLLDHTGADRMAVRALYQKYAADKPWRAFLANWEEAQTRHYIRYTDKQISFQEQRRARLRDTIDPRLDDIQADLIFDFYLDTYEQNWALFTDVLPCLERISPHRIGLVTNGDGQQQRHKLSRMGLKGRFNPIVISAECGYAKPDPRIFRQACDMASVPLSEALFIGDSYKTDIEGARSAGLQALWLQRNNAPLHTGRRPDLTTLSDLGS